MSLTNIILKNIQKDNVQLFFLLVYALIFLFIGLDAAALIDWDENIYAEASRQMLARQDYLNIYINGQPFAEKPPLYFWLQSSSFNFFGVDEFSARFPSAFIGLLQAFWLYYVGRKLYSHRLGIFWSSIFLSSFLPGIFAKTAVIDHTFNFFISLSTFMLIFYDTEKIKCDFKFFDFKFSNWVEFLWLFLASLSMGLAVLTKGPLGGVIPLVGFIVYKSVSKNKIISFYHIIFCGVLSLFVATSWYLINLYIHGTQFIENFIEFQFKLFSQSLEGHTGPFFYHFLVALFGIMPWTAFLFLGPFRISNYNIKIQNILVLCIGWILFVLILFSFVNTKLPHYSASIYIPLSFLIASILEKKISENHTLPKWFNIVSIIQGIFISVGFIILPYLAKQEIIQNYPNFDLAIPHDIFWIGGLILCLFIFGIMTWFYNNFKLGLVFYLIAMLVFSQGIWRYQVPMGLKFIQNPMLEMVKEAVKKKQPVVFYRFVSFAALFYGKEPIHMLHTYKFPGDPTILNKRHKKTISVITTKNHLDILISEHPLLDFVKEKGQFVLLKLTSIDQLERYLLKLTSTDQLKR